MRSEIGKHLYSLRQEGVLPAVLYGPGMASLPLAVVKRDFEKVLREAGETSLVAVKVEGGKLYNVLIHDVAKDPMTLEPIHADFYAVRMDKPIEAKVPLVFAGESPAVKNEGGILVKVLHELEVKALPKDLPHEISVDVSRLEKIGDKVQVQDVTLPAGVASLSPADEVVALIEPPRSEAELEELTKAEEAAPVAEVKTERETKAEAKEGEEAAEAEGE
ncbi:MAG: 50S ribosomal protein L25 [bacterium]|nr:50S ribosomal protein L25 [bacterium]